MPVRPFLKWVGSKRQLVPELLKHIPATFGTYHEPFLGGGALFFTLRPVRAVLGDANQRLIRTYCAVRDHVENVIGQLRYAETAHNKEFYYQVRAQAVDHLGDVGVAAQLIYLNGTCFNGLYRVNRAGKFNVPMGRYTKPKICDATTLRICSEALKGHTINNEDFRAANRAVAGDVVYFDSPYLPLNGTADFTAYTAEGFDNIDQETLRDLAVDLKMRGVHVVLSNAAHDVIADLYAKDFQIHEVDCRRSINSKTSGRGPVKEFIIT
jgi:DNA adenine methylase